MAMLNLCWFNPLVWLAFRRMRADRELACDALVLSVTPEAEHSTYGETIIKLLEVFSQAPARAALVGIMEDKNQMKRRIRMIANYRKAGRWSVCAGLLLPLIGALTFTQARTDRPVEAATPAPGLSDAASGAPPPSVLTVTIRKTEPYFYVGTKAIQAEDLRAELKKQAGNTPGLLLALRSEADAPIGKIAAVIDMANETGVQRVSYVSAESKAPLPDAIAPALAGGDPVQDAEAKSTDQTALIRRLKVLDRQRTIAGYELVPAREALKQLRLQYGEDHASVKQQLSDIAALEAKEKVWGEEIQEISARVRDFALHPQPGEAVSHPTPPFTRHFVRVVADLGSLAFEGESTTWPELPELLGQVPNRPQTVLELAAATHDMTLRQLKEAESKCRQLAAQYRFESLRVTGVQPARSKGSPAQEVSRSGSASSGATEADRRPRFIYVTGEVLKPGSIPMLDGTQYTVFDAIGQAGGLTKAAKQSKIQLIRQGRTQTLNLPALMNLTNTNQITYLEPGDTIQVPQQVW